MNAQTLGRNTNWLPHAVLWIGVFITAFPLWVTFVASTLTPQDIAQSPMQLYPGGELFKIYSEAWSKGSAGTYLSPPAWKLLLNSLFVALIVTFGKISVSLISAYAVVFFKFP
ncbi:MAG: glycerol-3-phosphate transporter, partial [Casimicrobium sp.]